MSAAPVFYWKIHRNSMLKNAVIPISKCDWLIDHSLMVVNLLGLRDIFNLVPGVLTMDRHYQDNIDNNIDTATNYRYICC